MVGVMRPTSIFSGLATSRTQQELLALANEMAQRIAYDTRDWTRMIKPGRFYGSQDVEPAVPYQSKLPLPVDFKRFLLRSNVYYTAYPAVALQFIPGADEWMQRRLVGRIGTRGEWTIAQNNMFVNPKLAVDPAASPPINQSVDFFYLQNSFINMPNVPGGGGGISEFTADTDVFSLDERLLRLGMIWQWKAQKGTPYAEDLGTYEDALARVAGADTPAPIIIGRLPISSTANISMPWPSDWGSVTR